MPGNQSLNIKKPNPPGSRLMMHSIDECCMKRFQADFGNPPGNGR